MRVTYKTIRILTVFLFAQNIYCQDVYTDQNNIHFQKIPSNEGKVEIVPSYSSNFMQNGLNSQSINSVNVQYQTIDDSNKISDYDRMDRGRTKKIFHIKNPFQQSEEIETTNQNINKDLQDSETGTSNQYAAMQYSLPPEEFVQQMRAENQYHQQQVSTPSPMFGYTATPQPPYQYSTISPSTYNNGDQLSNMSPQIETKHHSQVFNPNLNTYQYNNAYSFGIDGIQSTPSSVTVYLSTSSSNNQHIGTPSNNYVSSSTPIYLSSPTNLQSYYTSTLSNVQTGSPTYNNVNRHSSTIDSNTFNYVSSSKESDSNIHVNHYDNSANGVKYPVNIHQQYQTELPSSTQLPISSTYPDTNRVSWQNSLHLNMNNLPNSRQEVQTAPQIFQNYQQESKQLSNVDNTNSDTHRVGSMPSANNLFLSFVQPDYQTFTDLKNRERDIESQNKQDVYSHGDYGWKLDGRKPLINYDDSFPAKYPKQQGNNYQIDGSFSSSFDYDQATKHKPEKLDTQEFAKAAAKTQENMKKHPEIFLNNYSTHTRFSQNELSPSELNVMYRNNNNNQKASGNDNSNAYSSQTDLITALPYYYPNSREIISDNTVKLPFDNNKILQIDVSNVSPINDAQKNIQIDTNNRYNSSSYNNEDQNLKQFLKPVPEAYKDKNMIYSFSVKTKPGEDIPSDDSKGLEPTNENGKKYESSINLSNQSHEPQTDINPRPIPYSAQSNINNVQLQSITQLQPIPRPLNPSDSNSLRLNDIPYWLTQNLNYLRHPQLNSFNHGFISTSTPLALNQNVETHQIDVAASILNKLIRDKQLQINSKLEYDSQRESVLPTINGLRVVNPYNLNLDQVSEILKQRTLSNDINSQSFRNLLNAGGWDLTQLQQFMLKNNNAGQYRSFNGVNSVNSPFFELRNSGHNPYQGIKYSRSQEEEESLVPITDSTHNLPIGAVIEQDDSENGNTEGREIEVMGSNSNDDTTIEIESDKPNLHSHYRMISSRHRHPNSISLADRYYPHRKFALNSGEPYHLLKPPPVHILKSRSRSKVDYSRRQNSRQRSNKLKLSRIAKREPLFLDENLSDDFKSTVQTLLRPPPFAADDKSNISAKSAS